MSPAEPTRVGYVLKRYPRLSETFIVTEILAHEAAGLDVEIFALRPPVDGRFHAALSRVQASVTYLAHNRLRAAEFWDTMRSTGNRFPQLWEHLATAGHDDESCVYQALLLAPVLRDRGITHLHAHFGTAAASVARLAGRIADVPYSFTAHAKDIFHESVDPEALSVKLRDAAAVVTVSDFNLRFLEESYGADARTVERIYNGLDLTEFSYETPVGRPPTILAVGRLIEKKGFGDLIEACAILARRGRDFRCEILGDGELREALSDRIAARGLGDRVELLGPRPRCEVIKRMRNASVFAAPCVVGDDGNRDGLPTVLLEAMALGTPCVSTDVTAIPEVIRDGETGSLAGQNDPSSLAAAIERLLDDPSIGVAMSSAARCLVEEQFDIHRNTVAMRELFERSRRPVRDGTLEAV